MNYTAIITGITGQDGAYLSKFLLNKGYTIIGLTRSHNNFNKSNLQHLNILNNIQIEECDLLDFSSIVKILDKYAPDEIYNLAAQSSVGLSFEQPIGTISYNTISVLNILESIRILDLHTKFYQASSSEMYGKVAELPVKEDTLLHPLSPYAISKASAFWIVTNYRESYNIFGVNGILFNHESYLRPRNYFVKKVITTALEISRGKTDSLRVGNIDIKRDYGYAPDYVEAMWMSLQHKTPDDYIICSGTSVCLRDIIYYVFEKFKISKNRIIENPDLYRPAEIENLYGNNEKAKKVLGWYYSKSFFDVLDILIEEEIRNYSNENSNRS